RAAGEAGRGAGAQRLTGELGARLQPEGRPRSASARPADPSAGTAIVNDYGGHELFARQVRAHGRPGDVLVLLSTSGTSQNVVAAAKTAQELGVSTWAMTGPMPNPLAALCDDAIAVEAATTATVQEVHLALVHALCAALDEALGIPA